MPELPISPEQQRLLEIMLDVNRPPAERAEAGREINKYGDPRPGVGLRTDGLPDITWCEVPAGEFVYQQKNNRLTLPRFCISKYLITCQQYQTFVNASDGYADSRWWEGVPEEGLEWQKERVQGRLGFGECEYGNLPCGRVSLFDAVAFCRWFSTKVGYEVRLPTERQWEKAARGTNGRMYPWGQKYISGYANIDEKFGKAGIYYLQLPTPVGIYPQGVSPFGLLDVCGNLAEWCLNKPVRSDVELTANDYRLRGGHWGANVNFARLNCRLHTLPAHFHSSNFGFRIVTDSCETDLVSSQFQVPLSVG